MRRSWRGQTQRRPPRSSPLPPTAGLGFPCLSGLGFPRTCCSTHTPPPPAPLSRPSGTVRRDVQPGGDRLQVGEMRTGKKPSGPTCPAPHGSAGARWGAPRPGSGGGPRNYGRGRGAPQQWGRGCGCERQPAGRAEEGEAGGSAGRELTCDEDRLQEAEVAPAVLLGTPPARQGHGHVHLQRGGLGGWHRRVAVPAQAQARGPAAPHGGRGRRGRARVRGGQRGRAQVRPGVGRRHPHAGARDRTTGARPASGEGSRRRPRSAPPPRRRGLPARARSWGPRRQRPERARPEPGNSLRVSGSGALASDRRRRRRRGEGDSSRSAHTPPPSFAGAERRRGRGRRGSSSLKGESLQGRPLSGEGRPGRPRARGGRRPPASHSHGISCESRRSPGVPARTGRADGRRAGRRSARAQAGGPVGTAALAGARPGGSAGVCAEAGVRAPHAQG